MDSHKQIQHPNFTTFGQNDSINIFHRLGWDSNDRDVALIIWSPQLKKWNEYLVHGVKCATPRSMFENVWCIGQWFTSPKKHRSIQDIGSRLCATILRLTSYMLHLTGMIENAAGNEMENGKKFKVQSSKMGPWPAEREQSTKDVWINENEVKWIEHALLL